MSGYYEELFLLIDTDCGGTLSLDEVQAFCEKLDLPSPPNPQVIARLFVSADADRSDAIDKDEFSALCEGIKLVIGMTEEQMVNAYASHEIRRLFSYLCTHNGSTMRRDELRKAIDVLNQALRLEHPDTVISAILRDVSEVDFDEFKEILGKLCPDKPLTSVANVFLMEERRRREHLIKVKSMYEMRTKGKGRSGQETPDCESSDKKCTLCPQKDQHIETLSKQIATLFEEKRDLELKVREVNDAATREVQFTQNLKKLQNQLEEEQAKTRNAEAIGQAYKASMTELQTEILKLKEGSERHIAIIHERDQLLFDCNAFEKEIASKVQELQTFQERLARKTQECIEAHQEVEVVKQRIIEREGRIQDLERRESEVQVKEIESLRIQRLMAENTFRCEKKEQELKEVERRQEETKSRLAERTKELDFREDTVTVMERQARKYEMDCQEKWETVFRKAQTDLDLLQEKLNVRELELKAKEAEFAVREQIFEATQRKAEATSLPERERRLRILQNIEQQLSLRERNIRQPERQYVHQMLEPELLTLREENQQLQTQVVRLRVDLDAQQQKLKDEVEKAKMERQSWIDKSKLSIEQTANAGLSLSNSFAMSRSRRASIIGGAPPSLASPASSPQQR